MYKKILLIASFDSFLKSGFAICNEIGFGSLSIKIRLTQLNQLSSEQLNSILGKKKNIEISHFYHNDFYDIAFEEYDIVILSVGNAFHKALFSYLSKKQKKRKYIILSLFPGVIFGDKDSISSRICSDILLLNNKQDYLVAKKLKETNNLETNLLQHGLALAQKYNRSNIDNNAVYYIDQVKIPDNYEERVYLVKKLVEFAFKNTSKNIFIKSRVKLNERTVHKNLLPLEKLIEIVFDKDNLPKNLKFTYDSIELCLEKASLIITISSTVAFEAIYNNIPVAIISDFGTNKSLANEYFVESGSFILFDDIYSEELIINELWYDNMVAFPNKRKEILIESINFISKKQKNCSTIIENNISLKNKRTIISKFKRMIIKHILTLNFKLKIIQLKKKDKKLSTSNKLIKNTTKFVDIKYYSFLDKLLSKKGIFYGWGRKKSGQKAISLSKKNNTKFTLLEDGFIRSINLGINNSSSFSIVEDDIGIYYDATTASKLENILNTYDFTSNEKLMKNAKEAITLIKKYHVSKYNNSKDIDTNFFPSEKSETKKVLVIAQTFADSSLEYGLTQDYTTLDMIKAAIDENKYSDVYIKIHPDVLSGKKKSDIDINGIDKRCKIITENVNPISLLKNFHTVYTKTSQMGFEALLVGCKCVCFGMPFYAGWGITDDRVKCERRKRTLSLEEVFAASFILYTRYYNPYTKKKSDIIDTIHTIVRFRELEIKTDKIIFLFGFSRWKHGFVKSFLKEYKYENIIYINPIFKSHFDLALKKGLDKNSDIFIWGRKEFKDIENFAQESNIKITRIEDGFIRSVGLGSDLTRPYSLVIDKEGIYFDPTKPSTLETILRTYDFQSNQELLKEAEKLRKKILKTKISKYNTSNHKELSLPKDKVKILVSGQVEDDASIKYGASGMTNLQLLKEVKQDNPKAYIVFKPHPDVLSGNRIGNIEEKLALEYCDKVIIDVSMSSVLDAVDEVHTMTSLTGFEGLLYGKKVVTYGLPFFAGWGLTIDKRTCERRNRNLTLDELVCAVYILYPRYIDPKTLNYCTPSVLIDELEKEKKKINNNIIYKYKSKIYSYLSRTSQKILSLVK